MRYLLLIFLFVITCKTQAAIWRVPSLFSLVYYSEDILEAELIYFSDDSAVCTATSLLDPNTNEIITFTGFVDQFNFFDEQSRKRSIFSSGRRINIDDGEKFILFSYKDPNCKIGYSFSNAFYLNEGDIFFPYQLMNPDELTIIDVDTSSSWDELKANILSMKLRVDELKSLLDNAHSQSNNKILFAWLMSKISSLTRRECLLTHDCGWSKEITYVFDRIVDSGYWEDAWKAEELYYEVFSYGLSANRSKVNIGVTGRKFFLEKVLNSELNIQLRRNAFDYLDNYIWYSYEDSAKTTISKKKKNEIISAINRLKSYFFIDGDFQSRILMVFKRLIYSSNKEINTIAATHVLPFFIEVYQENLEGYHRYVLQEIFVEQLTEEKLQLLNENGNGILADITYYNDSWLKRIELGVRISTADANTNKSPVIIFQNQYDNNMIRTIPLVVESNYNDSYTTAHQWISYKDFIPGIWSVQVRSNPDNEMTKWKSNTIIFEIK